MFNESQKSFFSIPPHNTFLHSFWRFVFKRISISKSPVPKTQAFKSHFLKKIETAIIYYTPLRKFQKENQEEKTKNDKSSHFSLSLTKLVKPASTQLKQLIGPFSRLFEPYQALPVQLNCGQTRIGG